MEKVCLAILTTGVRASTLRASLRAIKDLETSASTALDVLVVQNGPSCSPLSTSDIPGELAAAGRIRVIQEPRTGIPFARNAALTHALAHDYDYLAFVDDDARPDPLWLANAMRMIANSGADGVTGPQIPEFPSHTPSRLRRAEIYRERRLKHGRKCRWAATNNVIFSLAHVRRHDLRFNETFLAGGSDKEFFARFTKQDGDLRWAGDAIVRELIDEERLNPGWMLRRAYRLGATEFRIERSVRPALLAAAICTLKAAMHVGYGVFILPAAALPENPALLDGVSRFARGCGLVLGIFSIFRNRSYA